MQRQNLQFAKQQTALKLSWNSLDLVHRASQKNVLLPLAIVTRPKKLGSRVKGTESGKLSPQQSLQGARTLLWIPFNVNSNIYVRESDIFPFAVGTEKNQSQQPLPFRMATKCLFERDFNAIARDGAEFQLFHLAPQGSQLSSLARPGLFS